MVRRFFALTLLGLIGISADRLAAAEIGAGVGNASFEERAGAVPVCWKTHTWKGEGDFSSPATAHSGQRSVAILSDVGADAAWYTVAPVEPFSTYRLSGWIKTENVQLHGGRGALLNLHNLQPVATSPLSGTRDWTRVEVVFDTDEHEQVQINCLLGGWGLATGKAWYDDVKLECLASRDPKPSIVIDAARTRAPISPYIYGQFIEHLGRCIYGGIWAEMLEDRKFFDAVGSEGSPWKPLPAKTAVEMAGDHAFVGEHAPRVPAGNSLRGIVQDGLGLRQGRSYVGRIWLAGSEEAGPVSVRLVWGDAAEQRQTVAVENLKADYSRFPLQFTSGGDTDNGRLEIVAAGAREVFIGTVSLMPEDNVHGMRADTLELLRRLDAPVYRWPGGNFVSGYDWRDGIGDPDRRPPRKNPAWKGIEHNDFGLDEFMTFCRLLETEPLVVINSGQGDVRMAVEELQYANGGANTPQGELRERNGCREPYGVKWWGVGNEMYGKWQLGYMPLEAYTRKHNTFADAMRGADPSIRLIAVGHVGPWSEAMLTHCAGRMDWISEHFYVGEKSDVATHVRQAPARVRAIADAHRQYRKEIGALKDNDIPIALDEWNYWYGPHLYGELGTRYFLKDALGVAAALNEFVRQSDMYFMANYAQTVNVIGCIKTTKTDAAFAATGLPLMLYRKHLGTIPVETATSGPLDAVAAWSEDRKTLTLAVVNPMTEQLAVPLSVAGARLAGTGRVREISGSDPMAYNEPDEPPAVTSQERKLKGAADTLTIPPLSISLFAFDVSDQTPEK